jgi:predicted ArsR family transcriptional regulator
VDLVTCDDSISTVAALDDSLRRGMYAFIRRARRPVTRDEAAASVGISRKLAAFHLDKLVGAGLLRASYQAIGGIRKVGRAPKVYEPTDTEIRVSIPARDHELLAAILMEAILTESTGEPALKAAVRAAGDHGHRLGATEPAADGVDPLTRTEAVLARHGFEPTRESPTCVRLRNCPFQPLAARAPEFVCGVNHAFLTGLLAGLSASAAIQAVLAPNPPNCCVQLRAAPAPS